MTEVSKELVETAEHAVTPLELFFDLVFVFAITQVTSLITHDPTWRGVFHGLLVLAAVWWAWTGYAWLTSTLDVDEGVVRIVMLAATPFSSASATCSFACFTSSSTRTRFATSPICSPRCCDLRPPRSSVRC